MKKILSSILCVVMMLSLGVTAFAETNDFVLTYSNEASYEISIPASGAVDKTTGKGSIVLGITDAKLEDGTMVSVSISSKNYAENSWHLVNTKNSSDKISYKMGNSNGLGIIRDGNVFIFDENTTEVTIPVELLTLDKVGVFEDTITFTSEIVELIKFSISGTGTYYAEEGMTLADWAGSKYNVFGQNTTSGLADENNKSINSNTEVITNGAVYYWWD